MTLFAYSLDQYDNIVRGEHPECCVGDVCAHCGASEANGKGCMGISSLAADLFKAAAANARNASVSCSPYPGWQHFDDHARLLDRAARALTTTPARLNQEVVS